MGAIYSLAAMITALTAGGFEVAFTAGPDGFWAHLDNDAEPDAGMTAGGKTIAEALTAALPEGFALCACMHARDSHWEHAEPDGHRKGCAVLGCRCRMYGEYVPAAEPVEIWAHISDIEGRLQKLEAGK
jgi:hypothetical protein